jgi:hypothetical protein
VAEFRETSSAEHLTQLEHKVKVLERQVFDLKIENKTLQSKALSADENIDKLIGRVNKVLEKLPDDVAAKLLPQSAYPNLHFPTAFDSFTKAMQEIVTGWTAIAAG